MLSDEEIKVIDDMGKKCVLIGVITGFVIGFLSYNILRIWGVI